MDHATYFSYMESIREDKSAIAREQERLQEQLQNTAHAIRSAITPHNAPALLLDLTVREVRRISSLVGIQVTDFAGQARYLRAICASVPFDHAVPREAPPTDYLLEQCDKLWLIAVTLEMLRELGRPDACELSAKRRRIASMTSLLEAGQRELAHVDQIESRVRRVFGPLSDAVIRPAIGVGTDEILAGFEFVREEFQRRLDEGFDLVAPAKRIRDECRRRIGRGHTRERINEELLSGSEHLAAEQGLHASWQIASELLLFKTSQFAAVLGSATQSFLDAFSFMPGEVNQATLTQFDTDEVQARPFARIGQDEYVVMDVFYAPFCIPRRLQLCFDGDRRLKQLNDRRDNALEEHAAALLRPIVAPDLEATNYFVRRPSGDFVERDILFVKDRTLFVIECKARPLHEVGQRADRVSRIATDARKAIQVGYSQVCDVLRALQSTGELRLYRSERRDAQHYHTIDGACIDDVIPIVVLDSYYGLIAADLQPWLDVDHDLGYPWVVDQTTLEAILLGIKNSEHLSEFVAWRRKQHGRMLNEDEAVFAGYFIQHGPAEPPDGADLILLDASYGDVLEAEYFRKLGADVQTPRARREPVWMSMSREEEEFVLRIDGKVDKRLNIKSGRVRGDVSGRRRRGVGVSPNDLCPCGSGVKFKKCCRRARR